MSSKSYTRVSFLLAFVLTVFSPIEIRVQSVSAGAAHPEFETISVKPGDPTLPGGVPVEQGGRFSARKCGVAWLPETGLSSPLCPPKQVMPE